MKLFLILENGVCLFPWNIIIKTTEKPYLSLDPTHFMQLRNTGTCGFFFLIMNLGVHNINVFFIGDVIQNDGKYSPCVLIHVKLDRIADVR